MRHSLSVRSGSPEPRDRHQQAAQSARGQATHLAVEENEIARLQTHLRAIQETETAGVSAAATRNHRKGCCNSRCDGRGPWRSWRRRSRRRHPQTDPAPCRQNKTQRISTARSPSDTLNTFHLRWGLPAHAVVLVRVQRAVLGVNNAATANQDRSRKLAWLID